MSADRARKMRDARRGAAAEEAKRNYREVRGWITRTGICLLQVIPTVKGSAATSPRTSDSRSRRLDWPRARPPETA